MQERLQKIISRAGVCSRRRAEELIARGSVKVNGRVVNELGAKADAERDEIRVEGKLIFAEFEPIYIMLHKPEGYISSVRDPHGRPTVMDLVRAENARLYPVGRLDWDSSGLLLMTNDGSFAQRLTHPSYSVRKTYEAKVKGSPDPDALGRLRKGVSIAGRRTYPAEVRVMSGRGRHTWVSISIVEGRNRQVRRMFEAVGCDVVKLKRTEVGPLKLGDLPSGKSRRLTDREVAMLKKPEKGSKDARGKGSVKGTSRR